MVNMKMSKEEAKEEMQGCKPDMPQYPYGLNIHLDDDALSKLGLSSDLNPGDEVTITAKATVESCSARKSMLGDSESSMSLQITDMEVGGAPSAASKTLYDKSKRRSHWYP